MGCLFGNIILCKTGYLVVIVTVPLQKCVNRTLVVAQAEMERWKHLSLEYMSDEGDDEENPQVVIIHPLSWRSKCML